MGRNGKKRDSVGQAIRKGASKAREAEEFDPPNNDKDDPISPDGEKDSLASRFRDSKDAKPWQNMIRDAGKAFQTYNEVCDNIDREYADLDRLRGMSREFKIFWSNLEILKQSVYSREPVPVVVPRFRDRRPLYREASEVIERCLITNRDYDKSHEVFLSARDDLCRLARGVTWTTYRHKGASRTETACSEHVNRKDFLHEPARKWDEVGWVARAGALDYDEGVARFGAVFKDVPLSEKDSDNDDLYKIDRKARIWEIWHKRLGVVVWISMDHDTVLDIDEPHVEYEEFFPCPKPAYGTCEPDSLIPVPDYVYYQAQIEEINTITERIMAMSDALRLKGFFAAGAEDVSDAIQKALKATDDGPTLVPVPLSAGSGMQSVKDAVIWMPVDLIAATIRELIALRKQLIEDVYQITGISDIMRGSTEASETLGAQELKSQFGNVRIQGRQAEMTRLCHDTLELQGEIVSENFRVESIREMSQTELPSANDLQAAIREANMAMTKAQDPQQQAAAQAQIQEMQGMVTIEQVVRLLRDQRLRGMVLEIETDSTIQPDEVAEKEARTEYVTMIGGLLREALPLLEAAPEAAPFLGSVLQFASAPFRAGRSLEGEIDQLVEKIKARAAQPKPEAQPDPADQMKLKREEMLMQDAEAQRAHDAKMRQMDEAAKQGEAQATQARAAQEAQEAAQKQAAANNEMAVKSQMAEQEARHKEAMRRMDEQIQAMQLTIQEMAVERTRIDNEAREAEAERKRREARQNAEQHFRKTEPA